jgi:hypothetical protein
MSKKHQAQIVTVLILAATVGVALVRKTNVGASFDAFAGRSDPTPQDAVYAMLDAGKDGDVEKYLASHTGQMEQSLRRTIAESSDFAQYLRNSNTAIKGIALNEPERLSDTHVKVRVEYVFADRNEVQFLFVEKTPGGWKIARVDSASHQDTPTPYGAKVVE